MFSATKFGSQDSVYKEVNISDGEWERVRPEVFRLLHQGYSKGEVLMKLSSPDLPRKVDGVVVTPS